MSFIHSKLDHEIMYLSSYISYSVFPPLCTNLTKSYRHHHLHLIISFITVCSLFTFFCWSIIKTEGISILEIDLNSQSCVVNSDTYMKGKKKAMSFSETLGAICWLSSRIAGLSLAKSKTSPNINSVCMCVPVCFCLCPILAADGNQVRTQNERGCLLFQWMLLSEQKKKE